MSDERWIDALVKVARDEEQPLDPRLERLVEGTISVEDRRALELEAANDPALREALEAFSPISDATRAQIAERVLEQRPKAKVISLLSRRSVLLVAVAMAAAIAFAVLFNPRAAVVLPSYALQLQGGERVLRNGEAPEELSIGPTTKIEAVLTPEKPVPSETRLEARLFVTRGGETRLVQIAADRSELGAARWVFRGAELEVADGEGWLTFVVAVPDRLDEAEAAIAPQKSSAVSGDGFRILSRRAIFRTTAE